MNKTRFSEISLILLPYMASLYYLEILYLLVVTSLVAGKLIGFALVTVPAVLLAVHLVKLTGRRETNRRIQLALMVLHIPYAVSIIAGTLWNDLPLADADIFLLVTRGIMAVVEFFYVIILTDRGVRDIFSEG